MSNCLRSNPNRIARTTVMSEAAFPEADEILRLTHAGVNFLEIEGQPYRFVRRFTYIASHGAIVFASE